MKMTNAEIISRHSVLMKLGEQTLPRKLSYAIARNIGTMEGEIKLLSKQIQDIAKRYAAKDEHGEFVFTGEGENQKYTFDSRENAAAFALECRELDEAEVDVKVYMADAEGLDLCDENDRYTPLTPLQEASICWMLDYGEVSHG